MDISAACVWARNGELVTDRRVAWLEEYPNGPCTAVDQTRNCSCGEEEVVCEDFQPPAQGVCTSGCGTAPHGTVQWTEERTRYAQEISTECVPQLQGRGSMCRGAYGAASAGTFSRMEAWCVKSGSRCATTIPLMLFSKCKIVAEAPAPAAPPYPAFANTPEDTSFVVIITVVSFASAACLMVWAYYHYERSRS